MMLDVCILHASHNVAAASTAPAPLKETGSVTCTVTGYFHVMNLAQPARSSSAVVLRKGEV